MVIMELLFFGSLRLGDTISNVVEVFAYGRARLNDGSEWDTKSAQKRSRGGGLLRFEFSRPLSLHELVE